MRRFWLIGVFCLTGLYGLALHATGDDLPPSPPLETEGPFGFDVAEALLLAQMPADESVKPREGRHRAPMERMKHRKYLEQIRILKMLELLDLREDQEVGFLTAFNAMRQKHRDIDEQINRLLDTLSAELRDRNAVELRINSLVDRDLALERDKHQVAMDFVEQARIMLTPEQLGRFVIFQKRFEAELLERIGRFRQGMGRESGRGPQGGG